MALPATDLTDQTMAEIATEMVGDGVWVDPVFARDHQITAEQERALESTVAATLGTDRPVRVVLLDVPPASPFNLSQTQFVEVLRDDLAAQYPDRNHDALYVIGDDTFTLTVESHLPTRGFDDYLAGQLAREEHPDDIGAQAVATVDLLRLDRDAYAAKVAAFDEVEAERRDERLSSDDGLNPFWVVSGLVIAGIAALTGVRWLWRRRSARRTGFQISPTVLGSVLAAEDRTLAERADEETLALGEALTAPGSTDAHSSRAAWVAALDHYRAARRVLEKRRTSADSMGALVLARLGESARLAALADRTWEPPRVCWVNPSHRWGSESEKSGATKVLVCSDCAARSQARYEFRVPAGSGTRAWHDADLGIWTRTGYGSTSRDFPAEVMAAFGR